MISNVTNYVKSFVVNNITTVNHKDCKDITHILKNAFANKENRELTIGQLSKKHNIDKEILIADKSFIHELCQKNSNLVYRGEKTHDGSLAIPKNGWFKRKRKEASLENLRNHVLGGLEIDTGFLSTTKSYKIAKQFSQSKNLGKIYTICIEDKETVNIPTLGAKHPNLFIVPGDNDSSSHKYLEENEVAVAGGVDSEDILGFSFNNGTLSKILKYVVNNSEKYQPYILNKDFRLNKINLE